MSDSGNTDVPSRVKIRQVRGVRGRTQRTRRTLEALGLGRIGKEREHNTNPAVIGMIKSVRHLIDVERV